MAHGNLLKIPRLKRSPQPLPLPPPTAARWLFPRLTAILSRNSKRNITRTTNMKIPALLICVSLAAMPFARAADADNSTATNAPAPTNEMTGTNGIILNFHEAPLTLVLDYLSEKAGYIVSSDDELRQKVTLESAKPVSKDELADVLNDMLAKNGYRATFNGRMLTIKRVGDAA